MNFLNIIGVAVKKSVIALAIVSSFAVAISAQRVDPQSQGKMYGDPGFRGEPINLNVVNADIREILSYITDQYGINFVIDKSVGTVPVTVKVNEVPWNLALDSVLQAQELGVQVNGNILRVADNKTLAIEGDLLRARQNNQLDTTPLITELIRLNYARAKDAVVQGSPSAGTIVDPQSLGASPFERSQGGPTAMNSSSSSSAGTEGILPIIQRRLSRRGSIEVDSRTNSLIITDVATNLAAVKQLISILDQPEPQVEIEARIVVATRNFSRDIGVQLTAFLNGGRGSGLVGGTLPNTPSTLINPQVPNPSISGDLVSKIANTAIGLTTGVFGTAQISAMITAGEQQGQAKVIATPRVTTLNNEKAEIKSGTKIPITTVQTGSAGGAVVATTTYVDVPLRLEVTPQITDLGTVILTVVAENASTAAIVGGVAPSINSQSMRTKVTVPDGGTTVVGGVIFDDERKSQDRTPGLASIPLLGHLFKRDGVTRNTNEILFFITPRITRPDYAAVNQSGIAPRPATILQPVPMGNPRSNSLPVEPTTPGLVPSGTAPVPSGTPNKP